MGAECSRKKNKPSNKHVKGVQGISYRQRIAHRRPAINMRITTATQKGLKLLCLGGRKTKHRTGVLGEADSPIPNVEGLTPEKLYCTYAILTGEVQRNGGNTESLQKAAIHVRGSFPSRILIANNWLRRGASRRPASENIMNPNE